MFVFRAICAARTATCCAARCGVVTTTASARGRSCPSEMATSPVPGSSVATASVSEGHPGGRRVKKLLERPGRGTWPSRSGSFCRAPRRSSSPLRTARRAASPCAPRRWRGRRTCASSASSRTCLISPGRATSSSGSGGGEALSREVEAPLLGRIPLTRASAPCSCRGGDRRDRSGDGGLAGHRRARRGDRVHETRRREWAS